MNSEALIQSFQGILPFFLVGLLGYLLAKKGWFSPESTKLISDLVMVVSVPAYLFHYICTAFTRAELADLAYGVVPPFLSIGVNLAIGFALCRRAKIPVDRHGVFITSFAYSNTIYIGLPVNLALFGEAAVPYVLLYYFANTTLFWTLGYYLLSPADGANIVSMTTVKKLLPPPMLGFLCGIVMVLTDTALPPPLAKTAVYVGNMTTPLVLLSLGIVIWNMSFSREKIDLGQRLILLGRFIVSPLVILLIAFLFGLPDFMTKVFVVQASLPVMSSITMVRLHHKDDPEYAALAISLSTLLSVLTIPLFVSILSSWF